MHSDGAKAMSTSSKKKRSSANILCAMTVYSSCQSSTCVKIVRSEDVFFMPMDLYFRQWANVGGDYWTGSFLFLSASMHSETLLS